MLCVNLLRGHNYGNSSELEKEIADNPLNNKADPCNENSINGQVFKAERDLRRI